MPTSLRVPSFLIVALLSVAAMLSGHVIGGAIVLALAAALVLPPFPPVVAGVATVLLAPLPAAAVALSTGSPWVLLAPAIAVAIVTLQWRTTAWSAVLTAAAALMCVAPSLDDVQDQPTVTAAANLERPADRL
ncbi:MAG: hypothetical protein AAGA54_00550 [Myxococcota bacterium]